MDLTVSPLRVGTRVAGYDIYWRCTFPEKENPASCGTGQHYGVHCPQRHAELSKTRGKVRISASRGGKVMIPRQLGAFSISREVCLKGYRKGLADGMVSTS